MMIFITLAQWVVDWETLVALESSTVGRKLPLEVPGIIPRRMKVEVTELPGGYTMSPRSTVSTIGTGTTLDLLRFDITTSITLGPATTANLPRYGPTHLQILGCSIRLLYCHLRILQNQLSNNSPDWDSLLQKRGLCNEVTGHHCLHYYYVL